ncbi:BsuPI-related putative proteinase inhibitor [Cytobacillus gottheilii]|uniref:Intracellular proteinase inhibitor BsuPI domain-containing protein n=1 Tax=Cytobacillus gottheilii TaxID=859144 RepID=A0ABX8FFP4_9BACI|nr:BsuPI-related putative proteinase inhibitor [Cytobacillus gottheilii]QVY62854.1 hypothetical protein J1899_07340 [Cytobacillus gottheilii]
MLNLWIGAAMMLSLNAGTSENIRFDVNPSIDNGEVVMDLKLENIGDETVNFDFHSSQKYEIEISDEAGNEIYTYSKGKSFLQVLQNLALTPGESKHWTEKWNFQKEGKELNPGTYKITAALTGRQLKEGAGPLTAQSQFTIAEKNAINVQTVGENGIYKVTGEVKDSAEDLYYTVEDGHHVYQKEQKVHIKDEQFEINIEIAESKLPNHATLMLNLYKKGEDEEISSTQPIVLERFNH